jgi:hypothetical protein
MFRPGTGVRSQLVPIPILDPDRAPDARDADSLNPRIAKDPRLSKAQLGSLVKVAAQDSEAVVMGLDAKMRPVVQARLSGPARMTRYALLRNGDPTKLTPSMAEGWSAPGHGSSQRRPR